MIDSTLDVEQSAQREVVPREDIEQVIRVGDADLFASGKEVEALRFKWATQATGVS